MEIKCNGILNDVLPEDFLELGDGKIVRNLRDLVIALDRMKEEDFRLHVYGEQNDFAEWVLEGYCDENLTKKIFAVRDKGKMIKLLRKVLNKEEGKRFEKGGKKDVLRKISEMR